MYCLYIVNMSVCLYLKAVFVHKLCVYMYLYFACKGLVRLKWLHVTKKSYMLFL